MDIRDFDPVIAFHHQSERAACRPRLQIHFPAPVCRRSRRHALAAKLDLHRLARRGCAPDMNGKVALDDHVIAN